MYRLYQKKGDFKISIDFFVISISTKGIDKPVNTNYYVFSTIGERVFMASTTLLKEAGNRQSEIDAAVAEYLAKGGSIESCPQHTPRQTKARVSEAYRRRRNRRRYEKRLLGPNPHRY